ncbi:MAG: peptidoglycan recognition family protein [Fimbriimonadales bacterium]
MMIRRIQPYLNHRPRPAGTEITMVVLHATAGSTLAGAVETLRERGFGYHFLIDKDGLVRKACPFLAETSHAGNSYGPNEAERGLSRVQNAKHEFESGTSVNRYTIGISFVNENDGQHAYTAEQEASVRELIAILREAVPSLKWLTTHAIVSPGRKNDPLAYDADRLAQDVGLRLWRPA